MCGIAGFVGEGESFLHNGRFYSKTADLLSDMSIKLIPRGRHSTGLFAMEKDSGVRSIAVKQAIDAEAFVSKRHMAFMYSKPINICTLHVRYATTGMINARNAHPHMVRLKKDDQMVWCALTHNGVIPSYKKIAEHFGIEVPEVDSAVVARAIAKLVNEDGWNIESAIEEVTYQISDTADFAFSFVDARDRSVYLWRNGSTEKDGRPLYIFDGRSLGMGRWWCSTVEIFTQAWGVNASSLACGESGRAGKITDISQFTAKPYRLYKVKDDGVFDVETVIESMRKQSRPTPVVTAATSTYSNNQNSSWTGYNRNYSSQDFDYLAWNREQNSKRDGRDPNLSYDDEGWSQTGLFE